MSEVFFTEQLDRAIDAMLRDPGSPLSLDDVDSQMESLLRLAAALRSLPREEFRARLKDELEKEAALMATQAKTKSSGSPVRKGYRTVTPYLTVRDVHEMIAFIEGAFGAEGRIYGIGSGGGFHSEYRIGDSMLMIGGGGEGAKWQGTPAPAALHLYVADVDVVYGRALKAGATSLAPPTDQAYFDREAAISDVAGNHWYIATHKGANYVPEGAHDLMPFLHPEGAPQLIAFMKEAFGAEEVGVHQSPDGVVQHAMVRIGNSLVEMGEAHGRWQAMPMRFMLYVDSVDDWYSRAIKAKGAVSMGEPAEQGYARVGTIKDPFENVWYIASQPAGANDEAE
jgi:PhnB protein